MIHVRNLTKTFAGDVHAVADVTLDVDDGTTLVLLGSSGSGKTTALKMINRLVEPTSGKVLLDGVDTATMPLLDLRRSIGYVFQDIGLLPHMCAVDNVAIVPRLLGWSRARRHDRAKELLDLVGLDPETFADRMPAELSGGQQQRVGIARALAARPKHLLMDEPFGALAAVTRDQLQGEVVRMRRKTGSTIVFVTHDLFEAIRIGDRIGVMHQGRLEQIGSARDLIDRPATPYVEALFDQAHRQAELLEGDAS